MKKILFFLFLLPAALASAQTAKDTVNVLTDAEISAGTLVDSVKMYYIQGNPAAWKKSRMDSLAAYMATKNGLGVTNGDKGDITVSAAGATWTIDAGAVTTAKLAADAVDSTKIVNAGVAYADLSQPVKDSLASYQRKITLTTTGTSGAATLTGTTLNIPNYAGVTDGDKGDITVSASGATWTIDNSAITGAKIAADAVDSTKISTSGIGRTDIRDSIITGAKIAQTTIPGEDMAITGMTGDASRLVGAITGGNLDTVRVGSGLQLSSGELRADTAAMIIACSDETTNITIGDAKVTFRAPFNITIIGVAGSLSTASSSGLPAFDINGVGGTTIFTTKPTIDANEKTTYTAATASVLDSTKVNIPRDTEMTIDIDTAGTGAKGLKVTILYRKN